MPCKRSSESGCKGLQAGTNTHTTTRDGGFKLRTAKRQATAGCQRAVQRRCNQAARLVGQLCKICVNPFFCCGRSTCH